MKTLCSLALIFLISSNATSQFIEQWQKRYDGPPSLNDIATAIVLDASNNIYVTGNSIGAGTGQDITTVKYNSSGGDIWTARYSGFNNDIDNSFGIVLDNSNNVIVTGFSLSSGPSYDYTTIKYSETGTELWVRKYNGNGGGTDKAKSIVCDDAGNIYVTGESYGGILNSYDYATVKYNSDGVQQWAVTYNGSGSGNDYANSIAIDNNHNVYVTGQSFGSGTNLDITTIKYNSAGVQQWVNSYNGPGNDVDAGVKVLVDNWGYTIAAGYSRGSGTSYDYTIIKYDPQGNQQWVYRFNGPQNSGDRITSAVLDNGGNIYVTGVTNNDITGNLANFATLKCSHTGAAQWIAYYNGTTNSNDSATSIALNFNGDVFVTGKSMGTGTSFDYATVRYNSSGIQQSVARYDGTGNSIDIPTAITIDNLGNAHVTGGSNGSGTAYDFFTLKYSLMTGIYENNIHPDAYVLNQNYPNPFNPVTNLEFGISDLGFVTLKVYDINGKEIATLVNENKLPGYYTVQFDGNGLSSGIYFYELKTENFSAVKKMTLIK